jgi:hypothetical protein
MSKERRTTTREALVLPVLVGQCIPGVTRDISAAGLFLEVDRGQSLGDELDLDFAFESARRGFRFSAHGSVVRIEDNGERLGVAVKLHTTRMAIVA